MILLLIATGIYIAGGILAFAARRISGLPTVIGFYSSLCAGLTGLIPAAGMFFGISETEFFSYNGIELSFSSLSSYFCLPVLIIGPICAFYSIGYMKDRATGKRSGAYWFFMNLTQASMLLVAITDTAIGFLVAWELMGLASFALTVFEYKEHDVRKAAWKYLLSAQMGSAFLIVMFILTGVWGTDTQFSGINITVIVLALIGFGLKSGFLILHAWMPDTYPATPGPAAALMSSCMVNMGIFGLLKVIASTAGVTYFCGWAFLMIGIAGALIGVMYALAQANIKRLLAYSSVENVGIICIGLGIGFLGSSQDNVTVAAFGFAGALLHILNHSLLKAVLFLCATTIQQAKSTLDMDKLGGLLKQLPWTGSTFILSSLSISGLPPFNGFLSELLIYIALLSGILSGGILLIPSVGAAIALALTGGLAAAAFVKASAFVFLGEPKAKSPAVCVTKNPMWTAIFPIISLFVLCVSVAVWAPVIVDGFSPIIANYTYIEPEDITSQMTAVSGILVRIGVVSCLLLVVFGAASVFRSILPRGREEEISGTWDCGYAKPDSRMQYTGTSFTQPLSDFLNAVIMQKATFKLPGGLFPKTGKHHIDIEAPDNAERLLWAPVFRLFARISDKVHAIQSGYLHLYIMLMVAALVAALLWAFVFNTEAAGKALSDADEAEDVMLISSMNDDDAQSEKESDTKAQDEQKTAENEKKGDVAE